MPHCAAFGCTFQSKGNTGSDITIHTFPKDKKRRKKWSDACGRTQLPKTAWLCSRHFSPDAFVDFSRRRLMKELIGATGYKRKLKPDAVPTIFSHRESKRPRKASEMRIKKRDREEMLASLLNGHVSASATSVESSDSPLIKEEHRTIHCITGISMKEEDLASPLHTSVSVGTICCPNIDAASQTDLRTSDAAVQWPADVQRVVAKDHTYDLGQEEHTESLFSLAYGADLLLAKHGRTRAKQKRAVSFVKSDRIGLHEEVTVQVSCLLQLFDRCLKCRRGACSLLTRREGTVLRVTQQCWTCRFINEWASHSQPADGQKATGDEEEAEKKKKAKDIEEEGQDQEEEDREGEEENEGTEEEEEESDQDKDENEEEEEKRPRRSKRKRRDSDEDWAPDKEEVNGEFPQESSDDDEGSIYEDGDDDDDDDDYDDGDRTSELFVWCRECEVEASSSCLRQRHPQLYCCVHCDADRMGNIGTVSICDSKEPLCPSGASGEGCGTSTPEADRCLEEASRCADGPACSGKQDGTHSNLDKTEHNQPISAISKDPHTLSNQSSVTTEIPHRKSNQSGSTTEGLLTTSNQSHVSSEIPLGTNSQGNTRNGGIQDGITGCELESTKSKPPFTVYFSDPYSLQSHMDQCHDHRSQRQLCTDCGKFFIKHNAAMAHDCEHKVKPFICATCEKRFSTEAGLHIHQSVHKEERLVYCQFCFKGFRQTEDKVKHEESHQGEALKFYCRECPKRFADRQSRSVHRKIHWTEDRFFCKYCDKGFKEMYHLQRHELLHTGKKPFTCEVCDRSFNQKGHLTSHMRLHTGERPFKCPQCERSFNHNVSLKNHLQRHHGPKTATAEQENQE